jgi:hypothetical protein
MALHDLSDELSVGCVGVRDEPVVHLTHTQHLLHNDLRIALRKLVLLGEEVGTANFYGTWCTHGVVVYS